MQAIKDQDDETKVGSRAFQEALGVVESMGEAGLTAVPVKPSAAMLAAGARAGGVTVETVWQIYQAMLKAAE